MNKQKLKTLVLGGMSETSLVNTLQELGFVSDNCVLIDDLSDGDLAVIDKDEWKEILEMVEAE